MRINRAVAAFVIAPLTAPAMPVALGCVTYVVGMMTQPHEISPGTRNPHGWTPVDMFRVAFYLALICYGGAILFGIPSYLWLCKRGIKKFWVWLAWGFGVGVASGAVLVLVTWALVTSPVDGGYDDSSSFWFLVAAVIFLLLAGLFGALSGAVHRLIVRPRKSAEKLIDYDCFT